MTILLSQAERLFDTLRAALTAAGLPHTAVRDHNEDGHPRLIVHSFAPVWSNTPPNRYGFALLALEHALTVAVMEMAAPGGKHRIVTYLTGTPHELVAKLYAFKNRHKARAAVLPAHSYRVVAQAIRTWDAATCPNPKKAKQKVRKRAAASAARKAKTKKKPK
jgi:hypothetical protein